MNSKKLFHYITACRIPFLSASLFPVILVSVYIKKTTSSASFYYIFIALAVTALIHISANTANDFYDWNRSDKNNRLASIFNGGTRNSLPGVFSEKQLIYISMISALTAIIIIIIFSLTTRPYSIIGCFLGLFLGLFYSLDPFSFQSKGLGEIAVFLAFGPILTGSAGYFIAGSFLNTFFIIGIPCGLLTCCILLVNQIPDYYADRSTGKKNITVRFGIPKTIFAYKIIIFCFFCSMIFLFIYRIIPVHSLIVILLCPFIFFPLQKIRKDNRQSMLNAQKYTVIFHTLCHIILITTQYFFF
jgi:1,4-dihydroxy-2-naphthoate octaprenyltransferase